MAAVVLAGRQGSRPHFLSLFSGCGGLDAGFLAAGFRCVAAFDSEPWAVKTYNANLPSVATTAVLQGVPTPERLTRIDAIVAGPPCQGFSNVGWRSHSDLRNRLLYLPALYALKLRVPVLVLENVPAAAFGRRRTYWQRLTNMLIAGGYHLQTVVLDAADFGLPQHRRRLFLIATKRHRALPAPQSRHAPMTLAEVLAVPAGVPNHSPKFLRAGSRAAKIASHIRPGQKLSNARASESAVHTWQIPEVFGKTTKVERDFLAALIHLRRQKRVRAWGDADPVSSQRLQVSFGRSWRKLANGLIAKGYVRVISPDFFDLRHTFNGKFRRLAPQRPANCVLTKFCSPEHFLHPFEERAFTVREAARLQGFPDTFEVLGPPAAQAQQIGNAVPPPLALAVAEMVLGVF